jgi:hypothetical protein
MKMRVIRVLASTSVAGLFLEKGFYYDCIDMYIVGGLFEEENACCKGGFG